MPVQFVTFADPQKTALAVSTVNAAGNKKTLSTPDGEVYSLQPNLTFETRPKGTAGTFEQCDVDGQVATFWYQWDNKPVGPYSVAFFNVTGKST
jgi:hypothetical protein